MFFINSPEWYRNVALSEFVGRAPGRLVSQANKCTSTSQATGKYNTLMVIKTIINVIPFMEVALRLQLTTHQEKSGVRFEVRRPLYPYPTVSMATRDACHTYNIHSVKANAGK